MQAGLVAPSAELSIRKRSLSPQLVVGIGLVAASDLDAVRGARLVVLVDTDPLPGIAEAADVIGEFTASAFFAAVSDSADHVPTGS